MRTIQISVISVVTLIGFGFGWCARGLSITAHDDALRINMTDTAATSERCRIIKTDGDSHVCVNYTAMRDTPLDVCLQMQEDASKRESETRALCRDMTSACAAILAECRGTWNGTVHAPNGGAL